MLIKLGSNPLWTQKECVMYTIDFHNPVHIHFIGIGGVSMSGLAELLTDAGFTVSGSDRQESVLTKHLESLGIRVNYGQVAANITDDIDVVCYTAAVHPDNPEFAACVEKGLPMLDRAELLGQVSRHYGVSVGVAGTHGKTTTTSMVSMMFLKANQDPTISVGGMLSAIGGNLRIGHSENFVFEACEYTNSFLKFFPTDEIILNIDADHLDFFKDLDDIRHSFRMYAERLPEKGILIINGEIPNVSEITHDLPCEVKLYGLLPDEYDGIGRMACPFHYAANHVTFDELGRPTYDLWIDGQFADKVTLGVIGIHNVSNSLAAIAEGAHHGIDLATMKRALLSFTGTERRFEKKGMLGGITVIDDYAHHPTEVKATLKAAKSYPHNNIWVVFQPHTYTRTIALRPEFVDALSHADKIVLADIYAAREVNTGEISSKDLRDDLTKLGKEAYHFPTFEEIEKFLLKNLIDGDLLITMGAGDIVNVGNHLLGK